LFVHLYQNNPTVGLTDGVIVSENDSETSPIIIGVNATNSEISQGKKIGIRSESTYQTSAEVPTIISLVGASSSNWALSLDNVVWQPYGSPISIATQITPVNTIFYCRGRANLIELPENDRSVNISILSQIESTL